MDKVTRFQAPLFVGLEDEGRNWWRHLSSESLMPGEHNVIGVCLAVTWLLGRSIACANFEIISRDNHEALSYFPSSRTAYLSTHVATFHKADASWKLKDARFAFSSRYATRR